MYPLCHFLRPTLQARMFESVWTVTDGLFIGDRDSAEDLKFFKENKVTRVINCCGSAIDNYWESVDIGYLTYRWRDEVTQTVLDDKDAVADEIFDFIEEADKR